MIKQLIQSTRAFICVAIICCIIYPATVYIVGITAFNHHVNGSQIYLYSSEGALIPKGALTGSELIGQYNNKENYFWHRPSAGNYDPKQAGGSNLPYTSSSYKETLGTRYQQVKESHPEYSGAVPVDMVTSSASGLDPHISPEAAMMQIGRVANARKIDRSIVHQLIGEHTEEKQWGLFGRRRVNVLLLNMALDEVTNNGG